MRAKAVATTKKYTKEIQRILHEKLDKAGWQNYSHEDLQDDLDWLMAREEEKIAKEMENNMDSKEWLLEGEDDIVGVSAPRYLTIHHSTLEKYLPAFRKYINKPTENILGFVTWLKEHLYQKLGLEILYVHKTGYNPAEITLASVVIEVPISRDGKTVPKEGLITKCRNNYYKDMRVGQTVEIPPCEFEGWIKERLGKKG